MSEKGYENDKTKTSPTLARKRSVLPGTAKLWRSDGEQYARFVKAKSDAGMVFTVIFMTDESAMILFWLPSLTRNGKLKRFEKNIRYKDFLLNYESK